MTPKSALYGSDFLQSQAGNRQLTGFPYGRNYFGMELQGADGRNQAPVGESPGFGHTWTYLTSSETAGFTF